MFLKFSVVAVSSADSSDVAILQEPAEKEQVTVPLEEWHHVSGRDIPSDAPGESVAAGEPASDDLSDGKTSGEAGWTDKHDTTGGHSGGLLGSAAGKEPNESDLEGVISPLSQTDPGETAAGSADQRAASPSSLIATGATDAASSLDDQPAQQPAEQGAVAESSPDAPATAAWEGSHAYDAVIAADLEETRTEVEAEGEPQTVAQQQEGAAASPQSFTEHTPLKDAAPDSEVAGRCKDDIMARSASGSVQEVTAADSYLEHPSPTAVIPVSLPELDIDDQQAGQQAVTPLAEESSEDTSPAKAAEAEEAAVSERDAEDSTDSAPSGKSDSSEMGQCPAEASDCWKNSGVSR